MNLVASHPQVGATLLLAIAIKLARIRTIPLSRNVGAARTSPPIAPLGARRALRVRWSPLLGRRHEFADWSGAAGTGALDIAERDAREDADRAAAHSAFNARVTGTLELSLQREWRVRDDRE